jgi:hypothetical protein
MGFYFEARVSPANDSSQRQSRLARPFGQLLQAQSKLPIVLGLAVRAALALTLRACHDLNKDFSPKAWAYFQVAASHSQLKHHKGCDEILATVFGHLLLADVPALQQICSKFHKMRFFLDEAQELMSAKFGAFTGPTGSEGRSVLTPLLDALTPATLLGTGFGLHGVAEVVGSNLLKAAVSAVSPVKQGHGSGEQKRRDKAEGAMVPLRCLDEKSIRSNFERVGLSVPDGFPRLYRLCGRARVSSYWLARALCCTDDGKEWQEQLQVCAKAVLDDTVSELVAFWKKALPEVKGSYPSLTMAKKLLGGFLWGDGKLAFPALDAVAFVDQSLCMLSTDDDSKLVAPARGVGGLCGPVASERAAQDQLRPHGLARAHLQQPDVRISAGPGC